MIKLEHIVSFDHLARLVKSGVFPVAFCHTCGKKRPVSVKRTDDGVWVSSCPDCEGPVDAGRVEFRDRVAMRELGWDIEPITDEPRPRRGDDA